MSVTTVEEFLINTCLGAHALRDAQSDLATALAQAGVPDAIAPLIASGRGPAISASARWTTYWSNRRAHWISLGA